MFWLVVDVLEIAECLATVRTDSCPKVLGKVIPS